MTTATTQFKTARLLAIITAAALCLLLLVHHFARHRIERQQQLSQLRQLNEVLPPRYYDNDILADRIIVNAPLLLGTNSPQTIYRAYRSGQPSAVIIETTAPKGYNGPIKLLVGIDYLGVITGVRVTQHQETPGLGDEIDIRVSDWALNFNQRSLENPKIDHWATRRQGGTFDQFTGATISPQAVVEAVRDTLLYYRRERQEIFSQEALVNSEAPAV